MRRLKIMIENFVFVILIVVAGYLISALIFERSEV